MKVWQWGVNCSRVSEQQNVCGNECPCTFGHITWRKIRFFKLYILLYIVFLFRMNSCTDTYVYFLKLVLTCNRWNCPVTAGITLSGYRTNISLCVFSSVPPSSRPQDSGNWIQFWVVGCYVGCDFHLTCICVCSFLCITLRLTPTHWSQSRDVKHRRAVETTHDHFIQKESQFFQIFLTGNEALIC